MKNSVTSKTAATPSVKTSTVFSFKTRAPIANVGLNKAIWESAVNEAGDKSNIVVVSIKLEPKHQGETSFMLQKKYNISERARGASAFLEDYNGWSENKLTEDDFYGNFDGVKDAGKQLVVDVGHRKVGKAWEAYIVAFHPVGTTELPAESK